MAATVARYRNPTRAAIKFLAATETNLNAYYRTGSVTALADADVFTDILEDFELAVTTNMVDVPVITADWRPRYAGDSMFTLTINFTGAEEAANAGIVSPGNIGRECVAGFEWGSAEAVAVGARDTHVLAVAGVLTLPRAAFTTERRQSNTVAIESVGVVPIIR